MQVRVFVLTVHRQHAGPNLIILTAGILRNDTSWNCSGWMVGPRDNTHKQQQPRLLQAPLVRNEEQTCVCFYHPFSCLSSDKICESSWHPQDLHTSFLKSTVGHPNFKAQSGDAQRGSTTTLSLCWMLFKICLHSCVIPGYCGNHIRGNTALHRLGLIPDGNH